MGEMKTFWWVARDGRWFVVRCDRDSAFLAIQTINNWYRDPRIGISWFDAYWLAHDIRREFKLTPDEIGRFIRIAKKS